MTDTVFVTIEENKRIEKDNALAHVYFQLRAIEDFLMRESNEDCRKSWKAIREDYLKLWDKISQHTDPTV